MPVIDDAAIKDPAKVDRIVICSGKVFYDLDEARKEKGDGTTAIIRQEQFYPYPAEALNGIFAKYSNAKDIVWTQEEPKNMGGWTFVEPRLTAIKPESCVLRRVSREPSASPATGSYTKHGLEQAKLIDESLGPIQDF